jgi:DNA-binding SARP family transcriptional activator
VVAAGALEGEDLAAVLALAQPRSGVAVVAAAAPTAATWSLVVDATGEARLRPLGLDLTQPAEPSTTEALSDLLAETASRATEVAEADFEPVSGDGNGVAGVTAEVVPWDEEATVEAADTTDGHAPAEGLADNDDGHHSTEDRAAEADSAVEVRVLGPVEVAWPGEAPKPQVTELVAYLATHPPVAGADRIRLALWPVDDNDERFGERAPSTFWTLSSKARKALGTDRQGDDLLRRTASNAYCLSSAVACDWVRFEAIRKGAADRPAEALTLLGEALGLVHGRPFQDVPNGYYAWVGLERLDSEMEAAVADAAGHLASAALEAGDVDTARFAVERGLLAVPGSESLLQAAMRVAAAAGDGDGIERAFRDARRLARALDPLGEPEAETRRLYEELREAKSGPAGESTV